MGQVPGQTFLLVGDGLLARHLAVYFDAEGLRVERWSRRDGSADSLRDLLGRVDRALLAIRDDAIQPFVDAWRDETTASWVHFSGCAKVDGAWSAHPLCTFGPERFPLDVYRDMPFIVSDAGPPFADLIPGLPNPSYAIPEADRPLYHALCVAAGNFTTLLWQRFTSEIGARWGLPADAAAPYLERTATNLLRGRGRDVLTGPIARGDDETMRENLAALEAAGLEDLADIYRVFARRTDIGTPPFATALVDGSEDA